MSAMVPISQDRCKILASRATSLFACWPPRMSHQGHQQLLFHGSKFLALYPSADSDAFLTGTGTLCNHRWALQVLQVNPWAQGSFSAASLSHFPDACTSPATVVVGVGWMCMSHPGWRCPSLGVSYLSCFIPTEMLILKIAGRCYGGLLYSLCQNKTAIALLHSSVSRSTATLASLKSVLQTPRYSQQNKANQGTLA